MPARGRLELRGALLSAGLACGGGGCGVANAPSPDAPPRASETRPVASAAESPPPRPPPVPWPMGWCVGWTDDPVAEGTSDRIEAKETSHLVNGRVMMAGTGVPPAPCAYVARHAANLDEDSLPDPSWVQIHERESGRELVVAVALAAEAMPQKTGANLIVEDTLRRGTPIEGHLYVRDGGGAPVLWISAADTLDNLREPPGIALERGENVASSEWTCGTWSAYDLDVIDRGIRYRVPYGERLVVGDHTIFHGGLVRDVLVDRCLDARAATAWLGVAWATKVEAAPPAAERQKAGAAARP